MMRILVTIKYFNTKKKSSKQVNFVCHAIQIKKYIKLEKMDKIKVKLTFETEKLQFLTIWSFSRS